MRLSVKQRFDRRIGELAGHAGAGAGWRHRQGRLRRRRRRGRLVTRVCRPRRRTSFAKRRQSPLPTQAAEQKIEQWQDLQATLCASGPDYTRLPALQYQLTILTGCCRSATLGHNLARLIARVMPVATSLRNGGCDEAATSRPSTFISSIRTTRWHGLQPAPSSMISPRSWRLSLSGGSCPSVGIVRTDLGGHGVVPGARPDRQRRCHHHRDGNRGPAKSREAACQRS